MTDESTLKKYISKVLSDDSVKKNADTYAEWLSVNKKTGDKELSEMMEKAFTDHAKSSATYGKNAEKISSLGLSGSGYADYLNSLSNNSLVSTAREINDAVEKDEFDNLQGYAKYLMNLSKNIKTTKNSLVSRFLQENRPNKASAYKLAIEYGFSEKDAQELAELAHAFSISNTNGKNNVLSTIINKGLNYDEAYRYALACGFSEDESQNIASASYSVDEYDREIQPNENEPIQTRSIKDLFWSAVFKTVFNK